jgi:hypothetical protein
MKKFSYFRSAVGYLIRHSNVRHSNNSSFELFVICSQVLGAIACCFFLFSCGSETNNTSSTANDTAYSATIPDSGTVDELTQFKYDKLISNIPIPFDILRAHVNASLTYSPAAMNPTANLPFYSSSTSKALNLGIYGGDLAYSITYEKFDVMGNYLKCAKKLADDLGIPLAFDQKALASYKKYETNKDSLEKIVFQSYSEVDKTLKSNERIGLAALVVTGGWVEGLHTTLKTLGSTPKTDKTKNLYKKIWEQKNYLDMILNLLEQFKDDAFYSSLIEDLKSIKTVYDNLSVPSDINENEVLVLAQKVEALRNKSIAR